MVLDPERDAERLAKLWSLDEHVVFLNHGSFGACPTAVLDSQQALRERLERQPVQMLWRELPELVVIAREELGRFVGADPEGLAFVQNATSGVNTVLRSLQRSLPLSDGDELLVTDQGYGACRNAIEFVAEQSGARVVEVEVPFPIAGPEVVTDAVLSAVTERTKLVMLDHVTSPTGLIFPLEQILPALRAREVLTLVDGAHAPGMLELQLDALDADFYVGNCHKWLCAPKSVGFIAVREEHREALRPLVISHGASEPLGRRFRAEFDWTGTTDPTPMLCVPEAIHVLGALLPGGWPAVRARNHALAVEARALLCDALELDPPCPPAMIGSMASLPLPPAPSNPYEVARVLLDEHRIETQIFPRPAPAARLLRVSAQLYNRREHFEKLASVLPQALAVERARG